MPTPPFNERRTQSVSASQRKVQTRQSGPSFSEGAGPAGAQVVPTGRREPCVFGPLAIAVKAPVRGPGEGLDRYLLTPLPRKETDSGQKGTGNTKPVVVVRIGRVIVVPVGASQVVVVVVPRAAAKHLPSLLVLPPLSSQSTDGSISCRFHRALRLSHPPHRRSHFRGGLRIEGPC